MFQLGSSDTDGVSVGCAPVRRSHDRYGPRTPGDSENQRRWNRSLGYEPKRDTRFLPYSGSFLCPSFAQVLGRAKPQPRLLISASQRAVLKVNEDHAAATGLRLGGYFKFHRSPVRQLPVFLPSSKNSIGSSQSRARLVLAIWLLRRQKSPPFSRSKVPRESGASLRNQVSRQKWVLTNLDLRRSRTK
jgi:hypothetical protein